MTEPRIVVVTAVGCHLCDVAREAVARIAAECGVGWIEQDVEADPELRTRWRDYVPVVFVDGRVHDWFRVDEARLRAALTER